jgi:hypothetical protein
VAHAGRRRRHAEDLLGFYLPIDDANIRRVKQIYNVGYARALLQAALTR